MNTRKKGFTLIEMLVVVGIIAVLSSAVIFSYGRIIKAAGRAKAMELVSNARTAFEEMYRNNDGWPKPIYNQTPGKTGFFEMDRRIADLFAKNNLLNVDTSGKDRLGVIDPWAQDVIMRNKSATLETPVPSGGKVQDHLLYFAVDKDDDGFVSKEEGAPGEPVRAKAIVWCAGADGGLSDCSTDAKKTMKGSDGRTVTNRDNVYSWERAQEDRK